MGVPLSLTGRLMAHDVSDVLRRVTAVLSPSVSLGTLTET